LIDQPSWRDTIRVSGLSALTALSDKRALELGFKYAVPPNRNEVRAAGLGLIGTMGKDDPRSLTTLTAALNAGLETQSFQLVASSAAALVSLGDARGLGVFDEALKKAGPASQFKATLTNSQQRLKTKLAAAKPGS